MKLMPWDDVHLKTAKEIRSDSRFSLFFLYLVRIELPGPSFAYKIGVSSDVEKRLESLTFPGPYEVLKTWSLTRGVAYGSEAKIKTLCNSLAYDGEPFLRSGSSELFGSAFVDEFGIIGIDKVVSSFLLADLVPYTRRLEKIILDNSYKEKPARTRTEVQPDPDEAQPVMEDEASDYDWSNVPNDELNGDRRHDAYHEKLRRSVEAVQEYNASRDVSKQFAITGSLLRRLSNCKPRLVKQWMESNADYLKAYDAEMAFGSRQNVGKPDPRSVIKWNESADGKYKW